MGLKQPQDQELHVVLSQSGTPKLPILITPIYNSAYLQLIPGTSHSSRCPLIISLFCIFLVSIHHKFIHVVARISILFLFINK